MPTVDVSREHVEYTGERLYHVKVRYSYHEPDSLIQEIHSWVQENFDEYDCETLTPGYWYMTTDPSNFAMAFKLTWEGPHAQTTKRNL